MLSDPNYSGASSALQGVSLLLVKEGNVLFVTAVDGGPTPPGVFRVLHPALTFDKVIFDYSYAARKAGRQAATVEERLYGRDEIGHLHTAFGLYRRVRFILHKAGAKLFFREEGGTAPEKTQFDFAAITKHFTYRPGQEEAMQAIAANPHGIIWAPTGFGKMVNIVMAALGFAHAKIDVVTRRVPVVHKLVDYLSHYIENVGQFGAGRKVAGPRVTVYTAASLGYSDFDCDILLGDEIHELAAEESAALLARYQRCRSYGFTATPSGRLDKTDLRIEALFGPVIYTLPYWRAVELGLVVPIQVEWSDVILRDNPARHYEDPIERKRYGIWYNTERNYIVLNDILVAPAAEQKLVLCDTIHHAIQLYRVLKDRGFRLIYDTVDQNRFLKLRREGFIPADEPILTPSTKEELRKRFEAGVGHYVSTPTWEVGIDPVHLQHVFLASPFASEIKATQAPGRGSRTAEGKEIGIVHDYRDQFDSRFCRSAQTRAAVFRELRWAQYLRRDGILIPLGHLQEADA
jgi:superfamily II DNA or RNA helicase